MMNKVFWYEIDDTLKVYMENIVMKSNQEVSDDQHLSRVFKRVRQYNMKLNP